MGELPTQTHVEGFLRSVLRSLGYTLVLCDAGGRVLDADDHWAELVGEAEGDVSLIDPRLVPSRPAADGAPGRASERAQEPARAPAASATAHLPFQVAGVARTVELAAFPLGDPDGSFLVAARTAAGRSPDDLGASLFGEFVGATDLASVVEASATGFVLWRQRPVTGELELVAANGTARRLAHLTRDAIGRTSSELAEGFPAFGALAWPLPDAAARGRVSLGQHQAHVDGEVREIELVIYRLTGANVGLALVDITAVVEAERERRRLLGRIADAEDAERKRLAEALHDDTIQVLAAVNMELGSLRRRSEDEDVRARAERIEEKVRRASRSLRSLVFELYPPDLGTGGLGAGVRALAARVFDDGTDVVVEDELDRRLGTDIGITAYRILQEALGNARRHAQARHVRVHLARDGDELVASVRDDGIGFDLGDADRPGHLGLRTMIERAASHDGSLDVRRGRPRGTEILLRLREDPLTPT